MFTGLVEALGKVAAIVPEQEQTIRLDIQVPADWTGEIGESVAINGCCLTAIELAANVWSFQGGS